MRNKFFFCGNNIKLYTHYFGTEPYLISIHDNVTCAADVKFINHDVSVWNVSRFLGKPHISLDKVGAIELYENSFVGAFSILMPNTSIGRNSILAAGSVLTKHIPAGEVWGGIPAKFIMTMDEYSRKVLETSNAYPWTQTPGVSEGELIIQKQKYFLVIVNKNVLLLADTSYAGMGPYVANIVNSFSSTDDIRFFLVENEQKFIQIRLNLICVQKLLFFLNQKIK